MEMAFGAILERLRFELVEVHCDNGPEFLNQHLFRFWGARSHPPRLSRSRPYHKNDNRFVEQKNSSLVRAYVGYARLDSAVQAQALARAYPAMGPYYNLFQPVMRLQEKTYLQDPGRPARVRRRYDRAAAPFERLKSLGALTPQEQRELEARRTSINPRKLREAIYQALEGLGRLPATGRMGDVRRLMAAIAEDPPFTLVPEEAALAR